MLLALSFLLLAGVAQPSALGPNSASCDNPGPDDGRPYTLCVAEADFERADRKLNRQWALTLARVRARSGVAGERRLRSEQRKWLRARDRECEAMAGASPVTQAGRNEMDCLTLLTEKRTLRLRLITRRR
jgi:uncharacterized protein YecT (DUF1311 family)